MKSSVLFAALALSSLACQVLPGPVPPDVVVIVDDAGAPPDAPSAPDAATELDAAPLATADAAPRPDAGGDVFDQACANLALLHCKEGTRRPGEDTCANVMRHAETRKLTQTRPDCVAGARTVAELKKCGSRYCAALVP